MKEITIKDLLNAIENKVTVKEGIIKNLTEQNLYLKNRLEKNQERYDQAKEYMISRETINKLVNEREDLKDEIVRLHTVLMEHTVAPEDREDILKMIKENK